ncbi:MC25A protein, partial [Leucopsar rothschildi]|nr:MC25A protein [Leucopsar rothschildi]
MGSSASSHGGRRVSVGLDERDQVRVLQGIRITEDVVNRMKRSSISITDIQRSPRASNGTAPSSLAAGVKPQPTGTVGVVLPLQVTEDAGIFQYVEEQALVQEELLWLAKREREAASEAKARNSITEERQKAAQLPVDLDAWAMELERREAELKLQENFYKEQFSRIEKK